MIKPMKKTTVKTKKPLMHVGWNLELLYKNDNDPQIEKDVQAFENAVQIFEQKYSDTADWLSNAEALATACADYEKLISMPGCIRPRYYFYFRQDLSASNTHVRARLAKLEKQFSTLLNKFMFFTLRIGTITPSVQTNFLKHHALAPYKYFLKNIFETAKHNLSEPVEKVINLMNQPAYDIWVKGFEKVLNNQEIQWKGKMMPMNEAFALYHSLPKKDRHAMWSLLMVKTKSVSDFAEAEINAIFTKHAIEDNLRGFKKPYSRTVLSYQNEEATVETVVATVTKHFPIAHRFFKLKARLMKEKKLTYADRGASIGTTKRTFLFAEAVEILQKAFARFGDYYTQTLNRFVLNGQVDVYPKTGKTGGAYCAGAYGIPTFVLLNHTNTLNSVITFGHEMGHAFHSELSKKQPPLYSDYTTSVAEVASTFFENLVFEETFARLSDKEKIVALHDRLNNKISSIFRQIACFNFENAAHLLVREKGHVSHAELAGLMNTHMKAYLGPVFLMQPEDGYFFAHWSHIRRHFYVYAYAFGELVSDALYAKYKKDATYKNKIEEFLSAGGSASPEEIFASVGIDVRHPKFFEEGLKQIEADIAELERLIKNK